MDVLGRGEKIENGGEGGLCVWCHEKEEEGFVWLMLYLGELV